MLIREKYLARIRGFYDTNLIKILVGIRRCGKSVILKQIVNELKEKKNIDDEHIIFINFELVENKELLDYMKLNQYVKEKIHDEKIYYLFLDEVQNVNQFEYVVNSLRASLENLSIFVTGSNSKLLSNELSTILSGRYVSFHIEPLSYQEYISLTQQNGYDLKVFWDYAKWGGLPYRCNFKNEEEIEEYLYNVYDSIIARDVVSRISIEDYALFDDILQYIIETIGREFSSGNVIQYLANNGKQISNETLYKYVDALCKALIIKKVYRYDIAGKTTLKTLSKYYVTDVGIAQIKNNRKEFRSYIILENLVYNELIYRGYNVYIGKTKNGEVDFLVRKNGETKYIQVTYKMGENENTLNREFKAFDSIKDSYPRYIISLDWEDLSKDGIRHIYLLDFLLGKEL